MCCVFPFSTNELCISFSFFYLFLDVILINSLLFQQFKLLTLFFVIFLVEDILLLQSLYCSALNLELLQYRIHFVFVMLLFDLLKFIILMIVCVCLIIFVICFLPFKFLILIRKESICFECAPPSKPRNIDPDRFCRLVCLPHCMQEYSQDNSKEFYGQVLHCELISFIIRYEMVLA